MVKLSIKWSVLLSVITGLVIVGLQFFWAKPALSTMPDSSALNSPTIVATAAAAPTLGAATLGGKPVYVLTMTRAGDRVLVRCYPGYLPTITIQSMGGANTAKEGMMTCKSPA